MFGPYHWITIGLGLAAAACGGATPNLVMSTGEQLAAARDLYEGDKDGDVWLQRDVQVRVATGRDPGRVTSEVLVRAAVARYAPGPGAPVLELLAPAGAVVTSATAHEAGEAFEGPAGAPTCVTAPPTATGPGRNQIDPTQVAMTCTLPAVPEGHIIEALVKLEVAGTIAGDAQWLGQTSGPTGELLLRYDLPSDAVGAFQLIGSNARPIVTQQNGRTVIALYTKHVARRDPAAAPAFARYATREASPSGYSQAWSSTWAVATDAYQQRLVAASDGLSAGFDVPFQPSQIGPPALTESYHWVQSRPRQKDAELAPWDRARELPEVLRNNDLNATEVVHLLHWVLAEAHIPHRFAMARQAAWPRIDPTFPVAAAFDVPLLYADGVGFLDPVCADCAPGHVRPTLRGGQAILLPVDGAAATSLILEMPHD